MVNRMILQGRLVRDPELRQTNSGKTVANVTIAWSEKYGETENKLFLNCTAWEKSAEFLEKYFVKGQEIAVEGRLGTRNYEDKEGNKRSVTEMTIDRIHFCGTKQDRPAAASDVDFDVSEDDLPF